MANNLQNVATYNLSNLAYLENEFCFINLANKKFKGFNEITGNLGDTVTFEKPPRMNATSGLAITTFGDVEQRVQSLTVDMPYKVSYAITDQQRIFNVEKPGKQDIGQYMDRFGSAAMEELGTEVESDVANVCISGTYRFYGDGVTAINSYGQLGRAIKYFQNFGSAKADLRAILPDIAVADIVNTGLNQFATNRNNEIAMDWMLGRWIGADWYESNLLPLHTAGTIGESVLTAPVTLTFVSINAAGTQVTFSGAAVSDADAVKEGDLFQFQDAVSGQPNMRYLTFVGHKPSSNPVQFRATADASSDGAGTVVIDVSPALVGPTAAATLGLRNQNLNNDLAAGMEVLGVPSHRAGLIYSGDALFLAMPKLPTTDPYDYSIVTDPASGMSARMYTGYILGDAQKGWVHDTIWGKTLVEEYAMRVVFPLSQVG